MAPMAEAVDPQVEPEMAECQSGIPRASSADQPSWTETISCSLGFEV